MKKVLTIIGMVLTIILLVIIMIACQGGVVGNGNVETRDHKTDDFSRLVLTGNFDVYLNPSGRTGLKMEMDNNLFEVVRITEDGKTLRIETTRNILQAREKNLFINIDDLEKLELNGAVRVNSESLIRTRDLTISSAGAARLDLELDSDLLKLNVSGASEADIRGKADEVRLHLSGAADFDLMDLIANKVEVDLSGAGSVRVYAKEELDVSISGVGKVKYRGDPVIHKNISGLGSLQRD